MSHPSERPSAVAIAVAGCVALAVAMGIGRFAFTPILPMMLHDGVVDLHAASWLASANYLGYLSGALLCTFVPLLWSRLPGRKPIDGPALVRTGLAGTGVLTLAMALPLPAVWPVLRFLAGVASAMVFVFGSGWCLTQLALRGRAALGGAMFAGPGAGIVASGLLASALVAWGRTSALAWLVFGVLACLLTASIWRVFQTRAAERDATPSVDSSDADAGDAAPARAPLPQPTTAHPHTEVATLAFAYGISGFGYIVTATFLPVIARAALPADSPWLDLFWPIFGAGVILGAVLATRVRVSGDLRIVLAGAYLVQAVAIAHRAGLADRRRLRPRQLPARPAVHGAHLLRAAGGAAPPAAPGRGDDRARHRDLEPRPDGRPADGRRAAAAHDRRRRGVHALAGDRRRRARRRRGRVPGLVSPLAEGRDRLMPRATGLARRRVANLTRPMARRHGRR